MKIHRLMIVTFLSAALLALALVSLGQMHEARAQGELPVLELTSLSSQSKDGSVTVVLVLTNTGATTATDVVLTFTPPPGLSIDNDTIVHPETVHPGQTNDLHKLTQTELLPGKSIQFTLPFTVEPLTLTKSYTITIIYQSNESPEKQLSISIPSEQANSVSAETVLTPTPQKEAASPATNQPTITPVPPATEIPPATFTPFPPTPTPTSMPPATDTPDQTSKTPGWLDPLKWVSLAMVIVAVISLTIGGVWLAVKKFTRPKRGLVRSRTTQVKRIDPMPEIAPPPVTITPPVSPPYLLSQQSNIKFPLIRLDKQQGGDIIGRDMPEAGITVRIDESLPNWDTVSRRHARIYRNETGQVIIEDTGSQNGIRVQGRPTRRNLLKNGWQVTIGSVDLIYYDTPASDQPVS